MPAQTFRPLLSIFTCVVACNRTPAEPTASAGGPSTAGSVAAASDSAGAPVSTPTPPPPPTRPAGLPAPDDVAAAPADAKKTASGLAIKVLTPGQGKEHPGPDDKVTVHYTGWTTDGKMFDSSVVRGEPTSFRVSGVIKGWTEGLQLMTKGEKARLWIPAGLAYGETPRPGMPAGMLVFDVELLDFASPPKPPPAPPDVKAAPANATKTTSGLAYRVLQKGTGTRHPAPTDQVRVHYTGWTTDGKMFDSSVARGEPATFRLNGVIKGWTEGVQLMVEGEKARFWIPGNLAYGDTPRPGAPAGTLVFDIELLAIQ
jgi:peptidylprolyl isomerase